MIYLNEKLIKIINILFIKQPSSLTPFNVRLKQYRIMGVPNSDKVSFIQWVLISINGNLYNISTSTKKANSISFLINNIERTPPYNDDKNGIKVFISGNQLSFSNENNNLFFCVSYEIYFVN